jgi:hypothetical protein
LFYPIKSTTPFNQSINQSIKFLHLFFASIHPLQYINILRKTGDVDRLTKAREAMSEIFPLSPPTWQQWIKDEISLNTPSQSVPS